MPKQLTWEPCPRCHSGRVEIRGVVYSIVLGVVLIIVVAPLMGLLLAVVINAAVGLVVGALLAILGVIGILSAPFIPKQGHCRDCQKNWRLSQAAA